MWNDLRYGMRGIARQKLFGLSVVLLLAIGIGSNTVIFSVLNSLLLKPLPVKRPGNLFLLEQIRKRQVRPETTFFYREFETVQQEKALFTAAIAEQGWAGNSFQSLALGDGVHLISTQVVSPNYFAELGVKAVKGRVLDESDAVASAEMPVVLSEQCWRGQFRGDSGILGRVIRIRNTPFVVVGVVPAAFHGIDADRAPDVRLPISAAPLLTGSSVTEPGGDYPIAFQILVRLRAGIEAKAAAGALTPMLTGSEEALWRAWYVRSSKPFPASELPEEIAWWSSYRVSLVEAGRGISRLREQFLHTVVLLMGAVGLLLLVVCANVAGLLLAKTEERNSEMGVRLALGASRWRLVRQLYAENALLAIPGALCGILFALAVTPWLLHFLPASGVGAYSPPVVLDVEPDMRVLVFAVASSLLAMALFGIAPLRRAWRQDLTQQIAVGGRTSSGVFGNGLVAFQIGLTALLVTASLPIVKTLWTLNHLNPGFDQSHVIEVSIDPWDAGFTPDQATSLLVNLRQRVQKMPGVRAVSFAGAELMRGIGTKTTIAPAGIRLAKQTFLNTSFNRITPEYFESLGIPLLAGRNLEVRDVRTKPTPIVVNRAFADRFFPGQNPIGKSIVQGVDGTKPPTGQIVGVVGTAKYRSMREMDPPTYYAPTDMVHAGGVMYVRTQEDAKLAVSRVRDTFRDLAPTLPIATIYTLREEVQASLWQERLVALMCGFFGLSALSLAGVGVYSSLSYAVQRRSRELGIRMAVGAQAGDLAKAIGVRLATAGSIGLTGGLAASAVLLRVIEGLLFEVGPSDPWLYATTAGAVLLCGGLAAALPTWRAIKIEPSAALLR